MIPAGEATEQSTDYLTAVFAHAGFKLTFSNLTWVARHGLHSHLADVGNVG